MLKQSPEKDAAVNLARVREFICFVDLSATSKAIIEISFPNSASHDDQERKEYLFTFIFCMRHNSTDIFLVTRNVSVKAVILFYVLTILSQRFSCGCSISLPLAVGL